MLSLVILFFVYKDTFSVSCGEKVKNEKAESVENNKNENVERKGEKPVHFFLRFMNCCDNITNIGFVKAVRQT